MKLDGFEVKVGDTVYDLVLGSGVVVSLHEDSAVNRFTVKFGEHRQLTFDEHGFCHHKFRTLYWHNPIIAIPAKDDVFWALQKDVSLAATELIKAKAQVLHERRN